MIERKKHTLGILKKMSFDNFQFLILASLFLLTSHKGSSAVKVTDISAGANHTLLLKKEDNSESGSLWAFGRNTYGQLGNGKTEDINSTVNEIVTSGVTNIATGDNHSLYVKSGGVLFSMGLNSSGQLGDGTENNSSTPVKIRDANVSAITAGANHSLYLDENGSLWAFGDNTFGQLGDGTENNSSDPVKIRDANVSAAAAGANHSLYLDENGSLWAFGDNTYGQLGDGSETNRFSPVQVEASGVAKVFAGGNASFYIKTDGSVWSMGDNQYGQLGDSTNWNRNRPIRIFSQSAKIESIVSGLNHNFFLNENGTVEGVGLNDESQLGVTGETYSTPVEVETNGAVDKVAAGGKHSLFLTENGNLYAVGFNEYGQLGRENTTRATTLSPVKAFYITVLQPDDDLYEQQNITSVPGTIAGGDSYYFDEEAQLSATENSGFIFQRWEENSSGNTLSENKDYTLNVSSDLTVKPIFARDDNDDDNDALSNYLEVVVYETNASNPDTDGDGFNDLNETNIDELNPNSPQEDLRDFFLESELREYNEGKAAGVDEGKEIVITNPGGFSLRTIAELNVAVTNAKQEGLDEGRDEGFEEGNSTGYELGYADGNASGFDEGNETGYQLGLLDGNAGFADGVQAVKDDPSSHGLIKIEDSEKAVEEAKAEAKAEALAEVQADLATEGLSSLTYLEQVTGQSIPHTDGWYYQPGQGWLWTDRDGIFPYIYRQGDGEKKSGWLWFSQLPDQKDKPLYDFELKDWISISGN